MNLMQDYMENTFVSALITGPLAVAFAEFDLDVFDRGDLVLWLCLVALMGAGLTGVRNLF